MKIPGHLEPIAGEVLGHEREAAIRAGMWVVVLGLTPKLARDDKWLFSWGEEPDKVTGLGDTPYEAALAFEKAMHRQRRYGAG